MDVGLNQRLDCKASPVSHHVQHSTKCRGLVILSRKATISFVSNKPARNLLAATVLLRMCVREKRTAIGADKKFAYPRKYSKTNIVGKAGANRKATIVLAILA